MIEEVNVEFWTCPAKPHPKTQSSSFKDGMGLGTKVCASKGTDRIMLVMHVWCTWKLRKKRLTIVGLSCCLRWRGFFLPIASADISSASYKHQPTLAASKIPYQEPLRVEFTLHDYEPEGKSASSRGSLLGTWALYVTYQWTEDLPCHFSRVFSRQNVLWRPETLVEDFSWWGITWCVTPPPVADQSRSVNSGADTIDLSSSGW